MPVRTCGRWRPRYEPLVYHPCRAIGFVQSWGGPVEAIRSGDVVWCPPGEKHWHGASPTTAMTHIVIVEQLDGKAVEWMEKVTDEKYAAAARRAKEEE